MFVCAIAVSLVVLALSFVPTPYYVIAPGNAVDLSTHLTLEGRSPALRRFYLTDVAVARASVVLLGAGLWPGVRLVRRSDLVPDGESARGFDRSMIDAMAESQDAASVVAERAAGYRVPQPAQTLVVRSVLGTSHASGVLADGDTLASVDGAPVSRIGDLRRALGIVRVGDTVTVVYRRAGRVASARIETISGPAGPRLGVGLRPRIAKPDLPVPVRYDMGNVAGSSGGLMFALQIYTDLRPTRARDPIAGTGTIALDGTVGKIEGAEQKLIAARRAGVRTFLVPRENYAAVANVAGVRVIPVHTFGEALAAIGE